MLNSGGQDVSSELGLRRRELILGGVAGLAAGGASWGKPRSGAGRLMSARTLARANSCLA